jgi:hypothetical protein
VLAFPELTPVAADVDGPLVWFAESHQVGFFALDDYEYWVTMAARTPQGFSVPVRRTDDGNSFDDETYLKGSDAGIYAIPLSGFSGLFFSPDEPEYGLQNRDTLASSTGHFVARSKAGQLDIYRPQDDTAPTGTIPHMADGCDALVGWAEQDRIACTRTNPDQTRSVVLFEIDSDGTPHSTDLGGMYTFPEMPSGLHRTFSQMGGRFAFTTADTIYVARVEYGATSVVYHLTFNPTPAPDAVLEFSPDEKYLTVHRGTKLSLLPAVGDVFAEQGISTLLSVAPACDENLRANPGTYCGEPRRRAAFTWSPDSTLLAYREGDGAMWVQDLRFYESTRRATPIDVQDLCVGDCGAGEEFTFQP